MTDAPEAAALLLTRDLWNAVLDLGPSSDDLDAYRRDVHGIQDRLLARVALRESPSLRGLGQPRRCGWPCQWMDHPVPGRPRVCANCGRDEP